MKPRILIVEDDPVSQEVIASLLVSRGYDTDTADDGFGALRLAQETNYDLVFIDYHLPEMDGYALARLMRSLGEKTNANLKMVAITADQFGLAARRGVDTVFDRVLSKPIEPETLFSFVDEFLGDAAQLDALEDFLAPPPSPTDEPSSPSLTLWRARGLPRMPTAAVFPAPNPSERASIEQCFRIVEPDAADCLILLRAAGLADVEALRREGPAFLQPLVVIQPELAPMANALFVPADGESWTRVAEVLTTCASRRRSLRANVLLATDFAMRLAAFLFVSNHPIEMLRSATGETIVPYAAGFPLPDLIAAVKQLASQGFVAAKLQPSSGDEPSRLVVTLTPKLSYEMSRGHVQRNVAEAAGSEWTPHSVA